jgi:branched-chain amino acid aminotransferase
MTVQPKPVVMINGELVSPEQAVIPVYDRGFLYGDSVFETLRTYGGKPFALTKHLERLERSAALVFIDMPISRMEMRHEILRAVDESGLAECYVRVIVTRGQGELGLDPGLAGRQNRVILVGELKPPAEAFYRDGAKAVFYRTQRVSDATSAEGAKIGNYLVAVLATREARKVGAQEALIVDRDGRVVEGATSNVFFVKGGALATPPLDAGILPGITRAHVLQAAQSLGLEVTQFCPATDELCQADEVFISSSIRELLPIVTIDEATVGNGAVGPLTLALIDEFRRLVQGHEPD